jgi:hypothetical protein
MHTCPTEGKRDPTSGSESRQFSFLDSRLSVFPQEFQRALQHLRDAQPIGLDDEVGVLAGMREAPQLLLEIRFHPVEPSACRAHGKRSVQVNEDVGIRDALPHIGDVRMLLRDVPAAIASLFQPRYQC